MVLGLLIHGIDEDVNHFPCLETTDELRLLEKGVKRCQQGDYQKAIGILERVLELDPANVSAHRNLGMALMETGQAEKARQYLVEAALLDPKDAWPYVVLGNALVRQAGQREAAARLLTKAHELAPADPWAMNSLGGIETERGDLSAAKAWFEKALAVKPNFANARYGLASALATQGHFDAARTQLGILFAEAEVQDVRSATVFNAGRDLWREITQQLASTTKESSLAAVREYLGVVSSKSGFPVKEAWVDFPENFAAQTQMAWKKGRDHHLINLRRGYPEPAWHHILAHEASHIALETTAREAGRNRWFVSTDDSRTKALKAMEPDIRKIGKQAGYSVDSLAELVVKLLNGASTLVFNCAIDMVIESRLKTDLPILANAQLLSLDMLAHEAASLTAHREIRKITPERLLSVNDTLNAVNALFLRDLSGGALNYVETYRPYHCLKKAESLYSAYQAAMAKGLEPGQEYDLVDEFATQLGVRAWYVWRPDLVSGNTGISATDSLQPKVPSRTIETPAALMFLVAALERLDGRDEKTVGQIAMEAALKGTTGLDLDSAEKLHSISAFGNERFSGLELLCLMHVALQRINSSADTGVNFGDTWSAALMMYEARKR